MDIMIDIESLSLDPRALVLSIGAVAFNLATGEIRRELYVELDTRAQMRCKRHISVDTVRWWVKQAIENPGAAELFSDANKVDDQHALHLMDKFICETEADEGGLNNIWALGPQFDMVALSTMYDDFGLIVPWRYNQIRDARTIRQLFREMGETLGPIETKFDGTRHNALADARYQTAELVEMVKRIKGEA